MTRPWIQTFTGRKFFPLDPRIEDIDIVDCAHATANSCRFAGHVRRFYSIAQHSVLVSLTVEPEHALSGLCHDLSEAFLIDVPTPLKQSPEFAGYRAAEKRLQEMIYQKFGCPVVEPPSVKRADKVLLATEARDLLAPLHPDWPVPQDVKPLPWKIDPLPPNEAKRAFLARFDELGGKR